MHPSRRAAIAVIVGSLAAVGCMNTEPKEQLALGNDTRAALGGSAPSPAKTLKPATFDPAATGGSGVSVQNSFNRTSPGPGTGTTTGNFASSLPPPQIGQQPPAAVAPALQGASYGQQMDGPGRTSMATTRAATPAPIPPVSPPSPPVAVAPPVGAASPFGQTAPKLDPPISDPPVRPAVAFDPAPPAPPKPIPPAMADPDRGSLPTPVMPGGLGAPVPPAAPPVSGVAANDSLPLAPAVVPSPSELPIPGTQSTPKLPPAPPILPTR